MSKWIQYEKDWFNLEDFCHIWIEERSCIEEYNHVPRKTITRYYAMGEWRHNSEEVIITQNWDSLDQLRHFLNERLKVYNGWVCK